MYKLFVRYLFLLSHVSALQRRKLQEELVSMGSMEGAEGLQTVFNRLYARRIADGDEYTADIWRRGEGGEGDADVWVGDVAYFVHLSGNGERLISPKLCFLFCSESAPRHECHA